MIFKLLQEQLCLLVTRSTSHQQEKVCLPAHWAHQISYIVWALLICAATVHIGQAQSMVPPQLQAAEKEAIWRTAYACPINATYLAMKMHGADVRYQEVLEGLNVQPEGTSLVDLRDFVTKHGLKGEIVRTTLSSLPNLDLPVIAHWEQEKNTTGHYVVIIAASGNGVEFIDGTSACLRAVPLAEFGKPWTGYVLLVKENNWLSLPRLMAFAAIVGSLSILGWLYAAGFRVRPRFQRSAACMAAEPKAV